MEKIHKNIGGIMPQKVKYVCRKCQFEFEQEIITQEEADSKRIKIFPIRCPRCNSDFIEERK